MRQLWIYTKALNRSFYQFHSTRLSTFLWVTIDISDQPSNINTMVEWRKKIKTKWRKKLKYSFLQILKKQIHRQERPPPPKKLTFVSSHFCFLSILQTQTSVQGFKKIQEKKSQQKSKFWKPFFVIAFLFVFITRIYIIQIFMLFPNFIF